MCKKVGLIGYLLNRCHANGHGHLLKLFNDLVGIEKDPNHTWYPRRH